MAKRKRTGTVQMGQTQADHTFRGIKLLPQETGTLGITSVEQHFIDDSYFEMTLLCLYFVLGHAILSQRC
jgi:hypothetical protein